MTAVQVRLSSSVDVAPERRRLEGRARQGGEERVDQLAVELQVRRKLPQQRSELVAEREQSGCEEAAERLRRVLQAADVRDVAAALDREHEVGRGLLGPVPVARRPLQCVEAAVELDRVQPFRGVAQFVLVGEALRIERRPPRGVRPAGDPDPRTRRLSRSVTPQAIENASIALGRASGARAHGSPLRAPRRVRPASA